MTKFYSLPIIRTDEECKDLAGTFLTESDCKVLIDHDADVICESTGNVIAKFRKSIIPKSVQSGAFKALRVFSNQEQTNRGTAAGWDNEKAKKAAKKRGGKGFFRKEGALTFNVIKKNGRLSNTSISIPVKSSVIGYMDSNPRFPYCRQTAFNQQHFDKFKEAYPVIRYVDKLYSELMPDKYALQRSEADKTAKDFVIKDTAFTTVTVNKNWQTAVHTDKGDFEKGFGNLVALRAGRYEGGYFVIPKWGVGFDLQNGDILLADVHQWHGNTPIKKIDKGAVRISLVMYYRKKMINCGTVEEELEKVKKGKG
jgi:hypothetical protein